jgi:hypothetical protein
MWDTIDGVGYDIAGKTYDKLADAALNRNSGSFFSFMFDLAFMGGGGGVLKHYVPIGIDFLKNKFPVLNKSIGELAKKGTEKVKNFFDKIFRRGQTSASGNTIATKEGAKNVLNYKEYKRQLRRQMSKPYVSNPDLAEVVDDLYRPGGTVGSGSTADAIRHELKTGQMVKGKLHSQKGMDAIRFLKKWLKNNPTASPGDRSAAENILQDLIDALDN